MMMMTSLSVPGVAVNSTYISDYLIEVHGSPDQSFKLNFQTVSSRVMSFTLNITLSRCPPGFYRTGDENPSNIICKCSVYDDNQKYNDIPYCDEVAFKAYIQPQHWAGYIKDDSKLVTSRCPPGYCFNNNNRIIELPLEASNERLDQLICSPQHRQGVLCGHCKPGYTIYANSEYYECGDCTIKPGLVVQMVAKFVPLYVFMFIIILLDINLASGHLNTFVFF